MSIKVHNPSTAALERKSPGSTVDLVSRAAVEGLCTLIDIANLLLVKYAALLGSSWRFALQLVLADRAASLATREKLYANTSCPAHEHNAL